jgi:hypothetical protein
VLRLWMPRKRHLRLPELCLLMQEVGLQRVRLHRPKVDYFGNLTLQQVRQMGLWLLISSLPRPPVDLREHLPGLLPQPSWHPWGSRHAWLRRPYLIPWSATRWVDSRFGVPVAGPPMLWKRPNAVCVDTTFSPLFGLRRRLRFAKSRLTRHLFGDCFREADIHVWG